MISELRKKVKEQGEAVITVDEFNQLQSEWIRRANKEDFAKQLEEKQKLIEELQDFAIWMTGCGYDFVQHEYFIKQRDKLLIST